MILLLYYGLHDSASCPTDIGNELGTHMSSSSSSALTSSAMGSRPPSGKWPEEHGELADAKEVAGGGSRGDGSRRGADRARAMEAGRAEKQTTPWSRREKTAPWRPAAPAPGRLPEAALAPVRPVPMHGGQPCPRQ